MATALDIGHIVSTDGDAPLSSTELLAQLAQAGQAQSDLLYQSLYQTAEAAILDKTGLNPRHASIPELVQDTVAELLESAKTEVIENVHGFLYTAATTNAIDYLRKTLGTDYEARRVDNAKWPQPALSRDDNEHLIRLALKNAKARRREVSKSLTFKDRGFFDSAAYRNRHSPSGLPDSRANVPFGMSNRIAPNEWQLAIDDDLDLEAAKARLSPLDREVIELYYPSRSYVLLWDGIQVDQIEVVKATTAVLDDAEAAAMLGITGKQYRYRLGLEKVNGEYRIGATQRIDSFLRNALSPRMPSERLLVVSLDESQSYYYFAALPHRSHVANRPRHPSPKEPLDWQECRLVLTTQEGLLRLLCNQELQQRTITERLAARMARLDKPHGQAVSRPHLSKLRQRQGRFG